jgi:exonuclease SbcC
MVKLLSLFASNFKRLNFDEPLVFGEGTTLITGPNESGKSTILDAVLYALYGRMIKPSAVPANDEIISYGASTATVKLDFSIQERRFSVTRHVHRVRANEAVLFELFPDGRSRSIARGQRPVSREIESLLSGITYGEILASNVLAQKDLERLVNQSREDRKRVVNAFLNLESFSEAADKLGEEINDIEGTKTKPGLLPIAKERLEALRKELEDFKQAKSEAETLKKQIDDAQVEATYAQAKYRELDDFADLLERYDKANQERSRLHSEILARESTKQSLEKQLQRIESLRKEKEEIQETLVRLEDLSKIEQTIQRIKDKVEELRRAEYEVEQSSRQIESSRIEAARHEVEPGIADEMDRKISKLRSRRRIGIPALGLGIASTLLGFVLQICGASSSLWAPLVMAGFPLLVLGTVLYRRVAQLYTLQEKQRDILAQLQVFRSLKERLQLEEAGLRARVTAVQQEKEDLKSLCLSVPRYSELAVNLAADPSNAAQAIVDAFEKEKRAKLQLQDQLKMLEKQISAADEIESSFRAEADKIEELTKQREQITFPELPRGVLFSTQLLSQVRRDREQLSARIAQIEATVDMKRANLAKAEAFVNEHKDIEVLLERQEREVSDLQRRVKVLSYAAEGIEKTAEALRARVKPLVEQYMSSIMPAITSGRYKAVQIDEEYRLKIWDPEAGEFKVRDVFSGGTDDQFLLALRLAFAMALLPEVKGSHPEFLFLDEPLGSADEARREGIVDLLVNHLSKTFRQIFIISHIYGLEERVQHVVRLEAGKVTEVF